MGEKWARNGREMGEKWSKHGVEVLTYTAWSWGREFDGEVHHPAGQPRRDCVACERPMRSAPRGRGGDRLRISTQQPCFQPNRGALSQFPRGSMLHHACAWRGSTETAVPEGLLLDGRTRKPPSTAARVSMAVASCRLIPVIQSSAVSVDDSPTSSSPANPLYADRAGCVPTG